MNLLKIREWIEEEKFYVWIVVFLILFHATFSLLGTLTAPAKSEPSLQEEETPISQDRLMTLLNENPFLKLLFGAGTLLFLFVLLLGLLFAVQLMRQKLKGELSFSWRLPEREILWTLKDVFHVVVLLVLSSYLIELCEIVFFHLTQLRPSESVRMLTTTLLTDGVAFYLIFDLVKFQKGQDLSRLGLSVNAFSRNFLFGLKGYLSLLPFLLLSLFFSFWIADRFHLSPPEQPLYDLFQKETSRQIVFVGMILVVLLGPVVEEIFFRGFLYNALKAQWGRRWAIVSSGLLFSALHANLIGFLPITLLGMTLAYGYELTGSLIASITIHVLHNTLVMVLFFFTNHFSQFLGVLS